MVCWLLGEAELEIAKSSPKGSFLNRIYTKNTYNWMTGNYSTCYYTKGPNLIMFGVMHTIIFFLTPITMGEHDRQSTAITFLESIYIHSLSLHQAALFAYVSNFQPFNKIFWMSDKSFYELPSVYYFRRSFTCHSLYKGLAFSEFENALLSNLNQQMTKRFFSTFEFKRKVSFAGAIAILLTVFHFTVLFEERRDRPGIHRFQQSIL